MRKNRLIAGLIICSALLACGVPAAAGRTMLNNNEVVLPSRHTQKVQKPRAINLTISVSGDLLVHKAIWEIANDYAHGKGFNFVPLFARIRPFIKGADLALCHLETPLMSGDPVGFPVFRTPRSLARAIKVTGWDVCSTASNHTLDHGQDGINSTITTLRRNGIKYAGSASSVAQSRRITILKSKGVKVAFLAYTQLGNGQTMPHPWSLKWAEAPAIISDAKRARKLGADVVIVTLHWGQEFVSKPTALQMDLANVLNRSRAITAVVGQHAHVVQPIRYVRGKLVVFGEGNLLANQGAYADLIPSSRDGLIALLRVRINSKGKSTLRRIDYVPTLVSEENFTVLPVGSMLRRGEGPTEQLQASWKRTIGVVGQGRAVHAWRGSRP